MNQLPLQRSMIHRNDVDHTKEFDPAFDAGLAQL
jgi:hypothetical protein